MNFIHIKMHGTTIKKIHVRNLEEAYRSRKLAAEQHVPRTERFVYAHLGQLV